VNTSNLQGARPCLFCGEVGRHSTMEHIVPASLGNTDDLLEGFVCDTCQSYLGLKVEKPALERTPFGFWKCVLGIRGRTGNLPSFTFEPIAGGVLPSDAGITTKGIRFTGVELGVVSLEVSCEETVRRIMSGRQRGCRVCMSPWHLSVIGRFLGKMGLEFLASWNAAAAYDTKQDGIRRFVRYGSHDYLWPIYWGATSEAYQRTLLVEPHAEWREVDCYTYSLALTKWGHYVFAFNMGLEVWLIDLSSPAPGVLPETIVQGMTLKCIYYTDWLAHGI